MQRLFLSVLFLFYLPAFAGTGAEHFRRTPALLDRMDQVAAELKHLPQSDDGEDGAQSIAAIARKLDAHPQVRAALARQGLTSREYATAMLAALHAGLALAAQQAGGARPAQGYTPEQQANVEVLRARQKARK